MTPAEIEESFKEIVAQSREVREQIGQFNKRLYDLTSERDALRSALKAVEAGIWVNGGAGDIVIDGKNEKIREAQFTLACHRTEAWRDASEALSGTINDIESCERDIDLRKSALRAKELQMQMRIEQMQWLTTPRFAKELS